MPHCGLLGVELNVTLMAQTTRQRTATAQFSIAAKEIKAKKKKKEREGREKRL
jgi:hypothetical protein